MTCLGFLEAIQRMNRALDMFIIEGIHTSIPLHKRILADPDFQEGRLDTNFIAQAGSTVDALAVQADGKMLVGGSFTALAGQSRYAIGRLVSGGAAWQTLALDASGTALIWNLRRRGRRFRRVARPWGPGRG